MQLLVKPSFHCAFAYSKSTYNNNTAIMSFLKYLAEIFILYIHNFRFRTKLLINSIFRSKSVTVNSAIYNITDNKTVLLKDKVQIIHFQQHVNYWLSLYKAGLHTLITTIAAKMLCNCSKISNTFS